MTRGNQRELAREKNAKKQQQAKKTQAAAQKTGNTVSVSTEKRMDRDAEIMRQKQQKAVEKKAADDATAGQGQKVVKVDPLRDM